MPVLFSLVSALAFGAGDFLGGQAVRRAPALQVTFLSQLTGFVLLVLWVPCTASALPALATVAWGAAGGLSGAIAALTLYPALAMGSSCVVAPVSAVVGTALPVLVGLLLGERPSASASAGIVLAALTIVLVSSSGGSAASHDRARERRALVLALTSGVFIGIFLVCFQRADSADGLWVLLVARAASIPLFLGLMLAQRMRPLPPRSTWRVAFSSGACDISANACFLAAVAVAPLSIVTPLVNLYPAFTVLLSAAVLRERPRAVQGVGLVLALVAVVLIAR